MSAAPQDDPSACPESLAQWEQLLRQVASGSLDPAAALLKIRSAPYRNLGFARPDLRRSLQQGHGEVIYGAGKTPEQIKAIAQSLQEAGQSRILITRLDPAAAAALGSLKGLRYLEEARLGELGTIPAPDGDGEVIVACACTSDLQVASEAAHTAEFYGNRVRRLYDVGIAGLHRLLSHVEELMAARVIIAVAGMEGALPSVIAGLVACPVIAVPTSVGYGASFKGVTALLAMLNSCASGVSVVNIDNGFGAAYQASLINHI